MPVDFIGLNKGPVVVIDDEIGEEDLIDTIISEIEKKGLPILKYETLNKAQGEIDNIWFANFIILDWRLYPKETPPEVSLGEELKKSLNKKKIEFIKKIKKVCFSPIFIFTNISKEGIKDEIEKPLEEGGLLYSDYRKNFIFIKNKKEIRENLFDEINKWILENPHVYLSKIWLNQVIKNSNDVFWLLYENNSNWPNVFYRSFEEDGQDPISGLDEILFKLVKTKMSYKDFDNSILEKHISKPNIKEIESLYKSIMYLDLEENIMEDIKPGDIFKNEKKYYINIRPECDTTRRKGEDTKVYLIEGEKISNEDIVKEKFYHNKFGIITKETQFILFQLDNNDFVRFRFNKFNIKKYSKIKKTKICRLLPPFITQFQHQFSSFLGRYGMPRVPQQVFNEIFNGRKRTVGEKTGTS